MRFAPICSVIGRTNRHRTPSPYLFRVHGDFEELGPRNHVLVSPCPGGDLKKSTCELRDLRCLFKSPLYCAFLDSSCFPELWSRTLKMWVDLIRLSVRQEILIFSKHIRTFHRLYPEICPAPLPFKVHPGLSIFSSSEVCPASLMPFKFW